MTTPNNDHLTALETYESVRDFFEPHLQRQWDKVLRSARRSAFAAAYDAIVNADQWPDGADALEAYWEVYEATLGVLGDFTPDYVDVYKATLDVLGDFTPDHPVDVPDDDVQPDDDVPDATCPALRRLTPTSCSNRWPRSSGPISSPAAVLSGHYRRRPAVRQLRNSVMP